MFEKMKMKSADIVSENMAYIAQRWPECLTEAKDENGKLRQVIDFDRLRQVLSADATGEGQERYQFTWPDKRHAIRLANTPTTDTLRPCREDSVDFDNTQNLYIEGDNLEVLKLLRESYLGKVKMIYIDPPYNTGGDFVYKDNFIKRNSDYAEVSGAYDEEGNQIVQDPEKNLESNGRFHTDWLNMIYPRLKVARDLLTEDGVIFISIDDNEVENLRKVCDEVFGRDKFVAEFPRLTTKSGKTPLTYMISHDYVLCYAKDYLDVFVGEVYEDSSYKYSDEYVEERGKYNLKQPLDCNSISYSPSLDYPIEHDGKIYYPGSDYEAYLNRKSGNFLNNDYAWRWSKELYEFGLKNGWIVFQNGRIYTKGYLNAFIEKDNGKYQVSYRKKERKISTIDFLSNEYSNDIAKKQALSYKINAKFDYPKPHNLISKLLSTYYQENGIVLDFFSGSSSTADAVMRLNAQDGGNRKFIMVQLPEKLEESNTGNGIYKTICDIAKERIRRVGKMILEEQKAKQPKLFTNVNGGGYNAPLDIGFRVLKLDSSNMENVFYTPAETTELTLFADNIKPDRTDEDLLFQVMMELGIALSEKIEKTLIAGKTVWNVNQGYLMACFEPNVTEDTIAAIAKQRPFYFVMADRSLASDNVADNFEQLFEEYSPDTQRRIL